MGKRSDEILVTLTLSSRSLDYKYSKMSLMCSLSFFLHFLISIIRNLNTFCINVHIHEMLLQGISTVIVIPLCNFLMSVTLLFLLCILLNNFRNLVLLEFGELTYKVTPAL